MPSPAADKQTISVEVPLALLARVDEVRHERQLQAAGRAVSRGAVVREALEALVSPAAPVAPPYNGVHEVRTRSRKPATDGGA